MKNIYGKVGVLVMALLLSCSNRELTKSDIDKFISKYTHEDFDNIYGISVIQRSRSLGSIVYLVGTDPGNNPPYIVDFSILSQSVEKINKSLLEQRGMKDYLTKTEIINAVKTFRKYDFYSLSVDSSENVLINPFFQGEPAFFLQANSFATDTIIRYGCPYKRYRGNWYVNTLLMNLVPTLVINKP